jgi:hypothetical protein
MSSNTVVAIAAPTWIVEIAPTTRTIGGTRRAVRA